MQLQKIKCKPYRKIPCILHLVAPNGDILQYQKYDIDVDVVKTDNISITTRFLHVALSQPHPFFLQTPSFLNPIANLFSTSIILFLKMLYIGFFSPFSIILEIYPSCYMNQQFITLLPNSVLWQRHNTIWVSHLACFQFGAITGVFVFPFLFIVVKSHIFWLLTLSRYLFCKHSPISQIALSLLFPYDRFCVNIFVSR